jgi:hypothetical protein
MTGQADPGERATLSIVGGGTWFTMWWPIGATWPLVRLDLFSWGMRIGGLDPVRRTGCFS